MEESGGGSGGLVEGYVLLLNPLQALYADNMLVTPQLPVGCQ